MLLLAGTFRSTLNGGGGGLEFYTNNRFAKSSPVFNNCLNTFVPDCTSIDEYSVPQTLYIYNWINKQYIIWSLSYIHLTSFSSWTRTWPAMLPARLILLGEIFWDYSTGKWTFLNAFLGSVENLYVCQQRGKCWKKGFWGKLSIVSVQKNIF